MPILLKLKSSDATRLSSGFSSVVCLVIAKVAGHSQHIQSVMQSHVMSALFPASIDDL